MSIEHQRNECFRKIGRNIYNYQVLELKLKAILMMCTFGYESDVVAKRDKIKNKTLGQLAKDASIKPVEDILENPEREERFHLIDFGGNHPLLDLKSIEDQFQRVIYERNELSHNILNLFNPSCSESCQSFAIKLDEQRESFQVTFKKIDEIFNTLKAIQERFREVFKSESLKNELQKYFNQEMISNASAVRSICEISRKSKESNGWVSLSSLGKEINKIEKEQLASFGKELGLTSLKNILKFTGLFEFREVETKKGSQLQLRVQIDSDNSLH